MTKDTPKKGSSTLEDSASVPLSEQRGRCIQSAQVVLVRELQSYVHPPGGTPNRPGFNCYPNAYPKWAIRITNLVKLYLSY
jgi:hypothetical protein